MPTRLAHIADVKWDGVLDNLRRPLHTNESQVGASKCTAALCGFEVRLTVRQSHFTRIFCAVFSPCTSWEQLKRGEMFYSLLLGLCTTKLLLHGLISFGL